MAYKLVQYGCGFSAPKEWLNFDASPTLRFQKIPLIGGAFRSLSAVKFPRNVMYGDVVKGLPIANGTCDALYSSHIIEHLSLADCRTALRNSFRYLKEGGVMRVVLPDLEQMARAYIQSLDAGDSSASIRFVRNTILGKQERHGGWKGFKTDFLGNSNHLWMWDHHSLSQELENVGFKSIRRCEYGDNTSLPFHLVENEDRFKGAIALECIK